MTQYQRITGKVFGGNATATGSDPQIAQFGSALANTFVGTTDPETIQSLPAWGQGWIGAVTPETQFPPLPEMTGAMKVLSHQICGILQQGVSTWDNGTIYYTGNFCSKNGIVYVSLSDINQGNDPEADTTNWRNYGGADIDLSNLSSQGQNIANWSTNVTNCITEIPQRIKLELNDGILILKAGSEVIVPNGFEADGVTRKFDYVTIESDLTYGGSGSSGVTYEYFLFYNITNKTLGVRVCSSCTSGTTAPNYTTYLGWYDTNENKIKNSNDKGVTWDTYLSLPIAQMSSVDGIWTKINQVFNGFGYMGYTYWMDKDIKCLFGKGKNEDGTLKSLEYTTKFSISSISSTGTTNGVMLLNEPLLEDEREFISFWEKAVWTGDNPPSDEYIASVIPYSGIAWYQPSTNICRYLPINSTAPYQWLQESSFIFVGKLFRDTASENKIKEIIITADTVNLLTRSDKPEISGWSMPSSKYIDLTLGATGTIYIAPANGYFTIGKRVSAVSQQLALYDPNTLMASGQMGHVVNQMLRVWLPVAKGDGIRCTYDAGGALEVFRFIYAEGEV